MPTDLPPDYVPKPLPDADKPGLAPSDPGAPGSDMPGSTGVPQPGAGVGAPGVQPDVLDPPGWAEPPLAPGGFPAGVPTPAGTPTF